MTAQEIALALTDKAANIAGLAGELDKALARHSDTLAAIPAAEAKLAAVSLALAETSADLEKVQAEHASAKAAYEAFLAVTGARR